MAIFNQIPDADLGSTYTHYGLIHGWVPVLFGNMDSESPLVAVENWIPEFTEDVGALLYMAFDFLAEVFWPGYKSEGWLLVVKGQIKPDGTRADLSK